MLHNSRYFYLPHLWSKALHYQYLIEAVKRIIDTAEPDDYRKIDELLDRLDYYLKRREEELEKERQLKR